MVLKSSNLFRDETLVRLINLFSKLIVHLEVKDRSDICIFSVNLGYKEKLQPMQYVLRLVYICHFCCDISRLWHV